MNYTQHYNLKKPEQTDYYNIDDLNENTEIIDNALAEKQNTLTAGANITIVNDVISASGGNSSLNRNLLDNAWFTVNQRGQSSYTSAGYGLDRWKINAGTLTINDDKTLSLSVGQYIRQYYPGLKEVMQDGKTYTMSAIINGEVYSWTFTVDTSSSAYTHYDFANGWIFAYVFGTNNYIHFFNSSGNATDKIKAVKLELGTTSTLTNETAPNYATELLKCQRYLVKLGVSSNYPRVLGKAQSADQVRFSLLLPTTMALTGSITTPTLIQMTNNPSIVGNGNSIFTFTINIKPQTGIDLPMYVEKTGAFVLRELYTLLFADDVFISTEP